MNHFSKLVPTALAAAITVLFSIHSNAATDSGVYNPDTGYSCNNKAGFKYGMTPKAMTVVVGSKKYYKGHSYIEYYDANNGETGVRLSGHGIKGGLCFNSPLDANLYLSDGGPCNESHGKAVGGNVGTNHPSITLRYNEDTNKHAISLSGDGIGGKLCFNRVSDGLQFAGYMKEKSLNSPSIYEEGEDNPGHNNATLELAEGVDGNHAATQTVHFRDLNTGDSLQSITWLKK